MPNNAMNMPEELRPTMRAVLDEQTPEEQELEEQAKRRRTGEHMLVNEPLGRTVGVERSMELETVEGG